MTKIMVINGPNLNMLGIREPDVYGSETLQDLEAYIESYAEKKGIEVICMQSNSEGDIIDYIHYAFSNCQGIVINPAAYTHYSYAIFDALKAVSLPAVEVHISDIYSREEYRHHSYTAEVSVKSVVGKGLKGYEEAVLYLIGTLN